MTLKRRVCRQKLPQQSEYIRSVQELVAIVAAGAAMPTQVLTTGFLVTQLWR